MFSVEHEGPSNPDGLGHWYKIYTETAPYGRRMVCKIETDVARCCAVNAMCHLTGTNVFNRQDECEKFIEFLKTQPFMKLGENGKGHSYPSRLFMFWVPNYYLQQTSVLVAKSQKIATFPNYAHGEHPVHQYMLDIGA